MTVAAAGRIARPHLEVRGRRWPEDRTDAWFTFVLFAASLFALQLSGLVFVYAAAVAIFMALRLRAALPALVRCAPIFILPAYALASTLWSVAPPTTFYYGSEYVLTVIAAILVGGATGSHAALKGMFAGFALWAATNFVAGVLSGEFGSGSPFLGLAGSKNGAGDAATLGLIIAVAMAAEAWRRKWAGWIIAAVALVVVETVILAAAQSTGAVIAAGVGVLAVLGWTVSRILPVPARSLILVTTILVAVVGIATEHLWSDKLFEGMLSMSGKDTTLTGRTYIWSRAQVLIAQRPWLGLGYGAFWRVGALEPEAIWRKLLITNPSGFHFHNSAYDIMVTLGSVGLALFALVFVVFSAMLLLRTMRYAETEGILFASLLVSYLSRAPFEAFGGGIFSQSTLLLFGALAWAVRPRPQVVPQRHDRGAPAPTSRGPRDYFKDRPARL
jgi:exopolysaccharide production protein ExoQ